MIHLEALEERVREGIIIKSDVYNPDNYYRCISVNGNFYFYQYDSESEGYILRFKDINNREESLLPTFVKKYRV